MDFNPAGKQGMVLYNKATEPLPEKDISQDKAASILQHAKSKNESYFLGPSVNAIPQSTLHKIPSSAVFFFNLIVFLSHLFFQRLLVVGGGGGV